MLRRFLLLTALLLPAAARPDDGRQMYGKKCLACHSLDGSGAKPLGQATGAPDLRASRLTQAEIERVIAAGRGRMPGYRDRLTAEQVSALAAYVREGLQQPPAGPPPPSPAAPSAPAGQ
jgi:mono/diheme cytochrome c family protein